MKKIITAVMALTMLAGVSTTAFATEINQGSNPQSADTQITTNIAPAYIVTIPADTNIEFNAQSTVLGTVSATKLQLEPNMAVKVSAVAGALENKADVKKTIPYKLMNGTEEFSSISLTDTTQKADLSVAITADDWNNASAGDYSGIINFSVSYEAE